MSKKDGDILKRIKDKACRELVVRALEAGWTARVTGSSHVALTSPAGKVVVTAATTGDHRTARNFRAQLKRAGLR